MSENEHTVSSEHDTRPTIVYMASEVALGATPMSFWSGVADGVQEHDLNLIAIVGGNIMESQRNIAYDLVTPEICSGIVAWSIAAHRPDQELEAIYARYRPLPMVTVSRAVPGRPVVTADDCQGMQEAVAHLIETHGCRRIAFVRALSSHHLAEERYRAYLETLAHHRIPFDPALVTPAWQWAKESGGRAVALFLDERGLRPRRDLDAIVSASDLMALGALEALQNRDIRVPQDLALVGFNDSVDAQYTIPSVTSVSVRPGPGRQAVSVLKDLLEQSPVPARMLIPTRLAVHQSCGCLDETVVQAGAFSPPDAKKGKQRETFAARRKDVLEEMLQAVGVLSESEEAARADELLQAFIANLDAPESGEFLSVLRQTLQRVALARRDVLAWQDALSAIQRRIGLCRDPHRAFLLLGQARTMVGKVASQYLAQQQLQAGYHAEQLRLLNQKLLTTFDVPQLADILAEGMRPLGIPGCYLAMYEDPQPYEYPQPAPAWSRLILAYDKGRQTPLEPGGKRFPTHQVLPEGMWPEDRRYTMVLQALHFQDSQIGFVLFEIGPQNWPMYDVLRAQISSALQRALILRERERAEAALEEAYAKVEQQVQERAAELEREQAESLRLQQEVIEAQQQAIRELSTPIIPVFEGMIVMPLIGSIDTLRARDVTRNLLAGIREHHAKVVILDITGVPIVDSGVAAYLNKTIQAARLKGARTIVTGVSDAVAETIVDLGIDWSGIETLSDLRTGLRATLAETGW
jgi:DNA-binding LacI/PurR family transcriptional regulator/anti-anti-sigma regulatory factor